MKYLTFYFSGTGNTKWVCEEFEKIIYKKGHVSSIISIESKEIEDKDFVANLINEYDYIGFAQPIYGANIPNIMREFIDRICKENGDINKKVYMINTYAYVNAFGYFCAKKLFIGTKFKLDTYINIKMCSNISTPKIKLNFVDEHTLLKRKQNAINKLDKIINKIINNKSFIEGIGPCLIPGIIIRKKSTIAIKNNYKELSVDNDLCSKCMLCVNKCPTKNIKYENEKFKFDDNCTACMRCYNFCPVYAITFNGIVADPKIYKRYRGPGE